jgi:ribosomal protein S18 acetylase RimI-like enzyme
VIDVTLDTYAGLGERAKPPPARTAARTAVSVRFASPADAGELAALHQAAIGEGFLASLGDAFLARLYRRITQGPGSFVIVASTDDLPLAGFVAVTADTGALYRRFLFRDGLAAAWSAAPQLARAPRRAFETLRYGSSADTVGPSAPHGNGPVAGDGPASPDAGGADTSGPAPVPAAELLALAVSEHARRRGVGRVLVEACQDEAAARGLDGMRVVVAADNDAALAVYQGCGFRDAARFEMHRGRDSEVLVWP